MKLNILLPACILVICFVHLPSTAKTADFSIGALAWYSWWVPPFEKDLRGSDKIASTGSHFSMNDSSFLYGPVASVKISERFSISGVFAFCAHKGYTASSRYLMIDAGILSYFAYEINRLTASTYSLVFPAAVKISIDHINRYDLDLTLNIKLNSVLKIFGGFKYQGYTFTGKFSSAIQQPYVIPFYMDSIEVRQHTAGLGLGTGINIHLVKGLYFLNNISGFMMMGEFIRKTESNEEIGFYTYGINGNTSLAYYIAPAKTTVSFGYRIQASWFRNMEWQNSDQFDKSIFHGFIFSVVYTI